MLWSLKNFLDSKYIPFLYYNQLHNNYKGIYQILLTIDTTPSKCSDITFQDLNL